MNGTATTLQAGGHCFAVVTRLRDSSLDWLNDPASEPSMLRTFVPVGHDFYIDDVPVPREEFISRVREFYPEIR